MKNGVINIPNNLKILQIDLDYNGGDPLNLEAVESSAEIVNDNESNQKGEVDEPIKYRCIINFNTFLYYALYLTDNKQPNEI